MGWRIMTWYISWARWVASDNGMERRGVMVFTIGDDDGDCSEMLGIVGCWL